MPYKTKRRRGGALDPDIISGLARLRKFRSILPNALTQIQKYNELVKDVGQLNTTKAADYLASMRPYFSSVFDKQGNVTMKGLSLVDNMLQGSPTFGGSLKRKKRTKSKKVRKGARKH